MCHRICISLLSLVLILSSQANAQCLSAEGPKEGEPLSEMESFLLDVSSEIPCGDSKTVNVALNRSVCDGVGESAEPGMIFRCDDAVVFSFDYLCRDVLSLPRVQDKIRQCEIECQTNLTTFYRENYAFTCKKPEYCPKLSTCQKRLGGNFMSTCYGPPKTNFKIDRLEGGMCQAKCIVNYSKKIIGNYTLTRTCDNCVPW